MIQIVGILMAALLSQNYILVKFYGICPFMGVSKKIDTALGMGVAVTFVMALASAACWLVNELLVMLNLSYMQTVAFILVIASIVQVAYISGGVGVEWNPYKWLSVNASPATWKATIVNNEALRPIYGLTSRSQRNEFGGNVKIEAKGTIIGDLSGYTRINLFSNFLQNPQNIDVDWTMRLDLKLNKWLSANINLHAIYDDDIHIPQPDGTKGRRLQLQEVAGVGLLVKF